MPRTILIHLNVEVPESRITADEIGDFVLGALEVGLEGAPGSLASGNTLEIRNLKVCCALVDEV
jgi:hypothetical protein